MKANPVWEVRAHNNHKKDNGGEKRTKMNEIELALLSTSSKIIIYKSCCELKALESRPVVPGVAGVPWHPHFLADQLTLSQPRGADYAHQIILAPPDFQTFRWP